MKILILSGGIGTGLWPLPIKRNILKGCWGIWEETTRTLRLSK